MRRTLLCLLLVFSSLTLLSFSGWGAERSGNSAATQATLQRDSTSRFAPLDSLLKEFYDALVTAPVQEKNAEFDSLISSCSDSLLRQHVTFEIFNHYRYSRVMGEEAVAVHIYDTWIGSGKVQPRNEFEQMESKVFADFNRQSLLGMTAPQISLYKPCRGMMTVPKRGRAAVLFFFDTSCAKCQLETAVLPSVIAEAKFPLDFYAIYVGEDKRDWKAFRRNFKLKGQDVRLYHLWDPDMDSDYQKIYGVVATPKIFFILEDGEIFGRRLEVDNLQQIISIVNSYHGQKE